MSEVTPILLVALVSLALGFALGILFAGIRKEKDESQGQGAFRGLGAAGRAASQAPLNPPLPSPDPPGPLQLAPLARPAEAIPAPESARPDLNPVNLLARALHSEGQTRSAPTKSIAAQVDEILQEKLAGLPPERFSAEKRAIRLVDVPGKGVTVLVGLDQYDGVEAVPDAAIRDLIHDAVKEWEARAFQGKNR